MIISLVIVIVRKVAFKRIQKDVFIVFTSFIILFLLFSSVNYFIPRYLLCIFPPFILISTALIDQTCSRYKIIYPIIIAGIAVTCLIFYNIQKKNEDSDYSPCVKTDIQVVHFCEEEHLQNAFLFVPSVLRIDFNEPAAGYLTADKFSNIEWEVSEKTQYCIFSSDEFDNDLFIKIGHEHILVLVKEFELGYAWRKIYKVAK